MLVKDMVEISARTKREYILRSIKAGIARLVCEPRLRWWILAFALAAADLWVFRLPIVGIDPSDPFAPMVDGILRLCLIFMYALAALLVPLALGTPKGFIRTRHGMMKAGLVNHAGEPPLLLSVGPYLEDPRLTQWVLLACGIPIEHWEEKQAELEAALNVIIVKLAYENGHEKVVMITIPPDPPLPEIARWDDSFMPEKNSVLALGVTFGGQVAVDLAVTPHVLLGGSTGSGKSVLLILLLMQAIKKGYDVTIADFKGGVDLPPGWRGFVNSCFDVDTLLDTLEDLTAIIEERKALFRAVGCHNIDEYIELTGSAMDRKIFACDEVAELLDRTGRSKEDKELIARVEGGLSTIARQGRAFGVHLILATQRPDANVIPGQIKNNMDCRACGRADKVLSQIVLDSTLAAEKISKDSRGRFILPDGTIFQAYWPGKDPRL